MDWWRTAVIYQVYPRSFADSDGDGIGDLRGIIGRLDALEELGVDALWLSPFYTSPQRDGGYDVADYCDVDPLFGSLADFDDLVLAVHHGGMRLIVDIVPNHSSAEHPWFQAALASPRGSAERARYLFRDGRGPRGDEPPNGWRSGFGGPAWTRESNSSDGEGQWYLHLFDSSQPDFDWRSPRVRAEFLRILRFWLDRGVDGFRVDVASSLVKADGLPEADDEDPAPWEGQSEVHEIYRSWRRLLEEYGDDRILVAEAWIKPRSRRADWVRPDEMHQTFNDLFDEWDAASLRETITDTIEAFGRVGAPPTWVLSNHDSVRHATSLMLRHPRPVGGVGPRTPGLPDRTAGERRARAAAAMMLALPGSAYLYQGEELGLPEVTDLPDDSRRDPTWFRTGGAQYGRDGCRVPLPWEADEPSFGFGPGAASWLPQPALWAELARDVQRDSGDSTLALYRALIDMRRRLGLGAGAVQWIDGFPASVLAFRNGDVSVFANTGDAAVALPVGRVLLGSGSQAGDSLAPDATVWMTDIAP
ncbi:glycoside hydrolase family 13 protein [Microbacterium sp. NPDC057659]|uniref:glycoside hydrolase family 13 protein n=1 Tax=Microbacterium sp. NPDC057659 TaxID=3346198 RepID=UPI003673536B